MALPSSARPLLVPAADVLAKNMRALDAARIPPATAASEAGGAPSGTRRTLIGMGVATEGASREARTQIRFRRAADDQGPSALAAFFAKLFPKKKNEDERDAPQANEKSKKSAVRKMMNKLLPGLEKASAVATRLPDPMLLSLTFVLLILVVARVRPHWLQSLIVKIIVIIAFMPFFVLAALWQKTSMFVMLRKGQNLLSHPAEQCMDAFETELMEREERVRKAEEELKKNRAQLDGLRKELAKDPNAQNPDAVIVPSRKAAAMIAAGALGAGYDTEAAQAVEQRRRDESVKRSREEWRAKNEEVEGNSEQTKESLKLMANHAATAYRKHTRELKTKSGGSGPAKGVEKLKNLRKAVAAMKNEGTEEDSLGHGASRHSEVSAATTANSVSSKKRLGLFKRKKRNGEAAETANSEARRSDVSRLDAAES